MREILFHGKRVADGRWIQGDFIETPEYSSYRIWPKSPEEEDEEVLPQTVGQYTGLVDSAGRKIFEGDVVAIPFELDGKPATARARVFWEAPAWNISEGEHFQPDLLDAETAGRCTVIGNIWDDPQLMEEAAGNV